jgi:hypothetical protein
MFSPSWIWAALSILTVLLAPTAARADLQFTQTKEDAGTVKSGAPLVREFAFSNRGPANVEILEIQGSCGCLKPKLECRLYKPGEGDTLRIEVNTLTQGVGAHSWRTVIRYCDGDAFREADVVISGTVVAEIAVEPPQLSIFADQPIVHELRVIDRRSKPFAISAVQTTSEKLTARITGEMHDDQGRVVRTVQLHVNDDFPDGRRDETLTIFTDDPLYRELKVPVTVVKRVRQRFSALPESVTLTAPRGQAIPAKIIRIRDSQGTAVEIESVAPSDPAISCTWARGPGANATLRITVDRTKLNGDSLRGSVAVKITKPMAETVVVPLSVTTP